MHCQRRRWAASGHWIFYFCAQDVRDLRPGYQSSRELSWDGELGRVIRSPWRPETGRSSGQRHYLHLDQSISVETSTNDAPKK
jgi:hypothetical protein